ncbi:MAG: alpha/beta fold hydrolase [Proteobacteria bacterium]|nr:alpha/beta fold hydrolase [Pseudomonadota bacterium]
MQWDECGSGIPVVLVHGIPTSPRLWRKVMPLVGGARLLAWEMVGFGRSIPQGRGRDISVRAQAGYLLAWLDALGLDRVVLAGHDLGGGVVQIAALRQPERCLGLLLTNAIGYDSWPIPSVKMLRATGGLVRHLPAGAIRTGVFGMLMARGHDDPQVARESLALHSAPYAEHGAGEALIRQVRALDVEDTRAVAGELPRLRGTPARVVWGAADRFQKIKYGARFAEDLGVPLERIEGGKHFTPEDHPDRIAAAITALIREAGERAPAAPGRGAAGAS